MGRPFFHKVFLYAFVRLNHANRDFALTFNNLSYSESQQKYSYRLRPYQPGWLVANGGEKFRMLTFLPGNMF